MNEAITIRPAMTDDAAAISCVLAVNRDDRGLFQESAAAVVRSIEDFLVACNGAGEIVGCAGLHRDSPRLAEIYAGRGHAAMPGTRRRPTTRASL